MIQSKPYTIPRVTHARLTAFYYLRTFWFILLWPFLFGIALVIFGPNQISRAFGALVAAWPLTVFARAYLLHRKVHAAWLHPTVLTVGEQAFLFESEDSPERKGGRFKLNFNSVRQVIPMFDYQLLQTRRFGFVAIPNDALPEGTDLGRVVKEVA
jgi:hypothetical protein